MAPPQEKRCTYAELRTWDDGCRYELYQGQPVALASPTDEHQRILTALLLQIGGWLEGKRCEIFPAPFDVRLFEKAGDLPEKTDTVVQPDLTVVRDRSKVDRHGIHGAPELVIEILSDSTRRSDRTTKYQLYQKAGVREYWIVDPAANTVAVHLLENGLYGSPELYLFGARVPAAVLPGCEVDFGRVFPQGE